MALIPDNSPNPVTESEESRAGVPLPRQLWVSSTDSLHQINRTSLSLSKSEVILKNLVMIRLIDVDKKEREQQIQFEQLLQQQQELLQQQAEFTEQGQPLLGLQPQSQQPQPQQQPLQQQLKNQLQQHQLQRVESILQRAMGGSDTESEGEDFEELDEEDTLLVSGMEQQEYSDQKGRGGQERLGVGVMKEMERRMGGRGMGRGTEREKGGERGKEREEKRGEKGEKQGPLMGTVMRDFMSVHERTLPCKEGHQVLFFDF